MVSLPSEPLAAWYEARLGFRPIAQTPVGGGCIHRAWRLVNAEGSSVFAKIGGSGAMALLEAEAMGLAALGAWPPAGLRVPQPLALELVGDQAMLVLPWLDLAAGGTGVSGGWSQLGQGLAQLHRASRGGEGGRGYGFEADNFIGSAPQANGWLPRWASFFVQRRLAPQLAMAAARGEAFASADAVLEGAHERLALHEPEAVLVHGDLWSGNAGLLRGGGAALFDPAAYWGDREVDLAMAQLFGGFPASFFAGYQATWPLPSGAAGRVELYNLYHLLNHANLFGGGYRRQAEASMLRLLEAH